MKVQTKLVTVWTMLILLGLPLAWVLFNDLTFVVQNVEILAVIGLALALTVSGWRMKRGLRSRMQQGLGREVDDSELTSIATWIKIPEQAAIAAKEAEKFDFETKEIGRP